MQLLRIYDFLAVELEEIREIFNGELTTDEPFVADMIDELGKFRGKMLRPMLVVLCGKACGQINHRHHVLAAVTEMVHMATLVHDDVLDEAEYRRRGRTINSLHGNESAVLLGDLLTSHAFRLCGSLESQLASRLIGATANTVCEGELMQLYYRGCYDLTEERYFEIISRKTASLIGICCYLGAEAAGADEPLCCSLQEYGLKLGMAFQIIDDVMDMVGVEAQAGKTLGTDLLKEKLTLAGIHYFSHCAKQEGNRVRRLLARHDKQANAQVVERFEKSGSIAYARGQARNLIEESKEQLRYLEAQEVRAVLEELADLVVSQADQVSPLRVGL